jgi:hypothetical protein
MYRYTLGGAEPQHITLISVGEPHHFYVAQGKNFYAAPAPAPAPAPTLLYKSSKFLKGIKVNLRSVILFFFLLCAMKIALNMHRKSNEIIKFVSMFENYPC